MGVEVLTPRDVPLGGLRAMHVRRTLPQRARSTIGAWCFVDHYGPDRVDESGGMLVPPHPHIGLQTVSWLFTGTVEHRDSAGHHAHVRPGELNLMTAGSGISHSEVSTDDTTVLHGAQLWVALPSSARGRRPGFEHYVPDRHGGAGWELRVFIGALLGARSSVTTFTPLLGAELLLERETSLPLDVDPTFEHGVLVDFGVVSVNGQEVKPGELAYVEPGTGVHLRAHEGARLLVLGGPPFEEPLVMWWNFVGRDHDEIVRARADWQAQIETGDGIARDTQDIFDGRFGIVVGDHLPPIPAPALPGVRLRPRTRP